MFGDLLGMPNLLGTPSRSDSSPFFSAAAAASTSMAPMSDLIAQIAAPQSSDLLALLHFQLLCQQPQLFSQLFPTPPKVVDVREVPEEPPLPIPSTPTPQSRKRSAQSPTPPPALQKRQKQIRRLNSSDAETNSPVSGMFIKDASEVSADDLQKASELDETASCVHISEESRRQIAAIPNVIGDSVCSLCKVKFEDVFRLAMHRCPRIVHEEYRCPECEKVFSCPANLASHRRWHRPRNADNGSHCLYCSQRFETKKALRDHKCSLKGTSMSASSSVHSPDPLDLASTGSPSSQFSANSSPPLPLIHLGLGSGSLDIRGDQLLRV